MDLHQAFAGAVMIRTRHQLGAGRCAERCCVEVRQDDASVGQAVDIGSGNLAAENAEVCVTEVIGDDQDKVWGRSGTRIVLPRCVSRYIRTGGCHR